MTQMNLILAEISDKMPTIWQLWVRSVLFSIPVLLGIVHKWISWLFVLLASIYSIGFGYISFYEAFKEPGFADAVQEEMGGWWIANSIASDFLPAVVALTILFWHLKKRPAIEGHK